MFNCKFVKTKIAVALLAAAFAQSSSAAATAYAQDFEGVNAANQFALGVVGGEGFRYYADVWFGNVGTVFLYNYGGSAPNGGPAFSAVATGEGGLYQGTQYLNVYSDYGNRTAQDGGLNINTSLFRESTIALGDIGSTWTLTFDAKSPFQNGIFDRNTTTGVPKVSGTTATAFIKTLDPNANFATTNDIRVDMTSVSNTEWGQYTISLDLTNPALVGQLIQFGFNTIATNDDNTGIYYDNICFDNAGGCPGLPNPVPLPAAAWLFGSALMGLTGIARRRRKA